MLLDMEVGHGIVPKSSGNIKTGQYAEIYQRSINHIFPNATVLEQ